MRLPVRPVLAVLALALMAAPARAQSRLPAFLPGASFDPSIPTLESVAGHAIREEVTSPEEIGDLVISVRAGLPVYVRDVATVAAGYQKRFASVFYLGENWFG